MGLIANTAEYEDVACRDWEVSLRGIGYGGSTSAGATLSAEENEGGCPPRSATQDYTRLLLQPESAAGTVICMYTCIHVLTQQGVKLSRCSNQSCSSQMRKLFHLQIHHHNTWPTVADWNLKKYTNVVVNIVSFLVISLSPFLFLSVCLSICACRFSYMRTLPSLGQRWMWTASSLRQLKRMRTNPSWRLPGMCSRWDISEGHLRTKSVLAL